MQSQSKGIIFDKFKEIYNVCKEECHDIKEASEEQLGKITKLYGYTATGRVFYNEFNLILFSLSDANFFNNILPRGSLLVQVSVSEYGLGFFILRRTNDGVLDSILS